MPSNKNFGPMKNPLDKIPMRENSGLTKYPGRHDGSRPTRATMAYNP